MNIRVTAHRSYSDVYNIQQSFEESTRTLSDAIKEIHQKAVIIDGKCLTSSLDFKGCRAAKYMITITIDVDNEYEEEVVDIKQELKHVLKLHNWAEY